MAVPTLTRNNGNQVVAPRVSLPDPVQVSLPASGSVPAMERNCQVILTPMVERPIQVRPVCCDGDDDGHGETGLPDSFETVAANLSAADAAFTYTGDDLTGIAYANGVIKALAYGPDGLASVTLSGAVPGGIDLVKSLTYTGGELTAISYG